MNTHRTVSLFSKKCLWGYLVFPIIFLAIFFSTVEGYAQMAISPTIVEEKVYPGGLKTFTLNISNMGNTPLECTLGTSSMTVHGGGLPVEVDEASRSCRDWITVNPEAISLNPKEGRRIVCRVKTPRETVGGYYAMIWCHGKPVVGDETPGGESATKAGVRFSFRNMAVVLLTVPGSDIRAIVDAGVPVITQTKEGSGYNFLLPVRNRGNMHARITGTADIRSEAGQAVENIQLTAGRGFLLPEHQRILTNKGAVNLSDGVYNADISLNIEGSGHPMRRTVPFYVRQGRPVVSEITDELKKDLEGQSAGFAVTPSTILAEARAGGRRSQAVQVMNLTKETLNLRASIMEWTRGMDGIDRVSKDTPFHGRSASNYLSLQSAEIELPPLAKRRLPVSIILPKETTGEYYAAVSFDRVDIKLSDSPTELARRSVLARVQAQGTLEPMAEIIDLKAERQESGIIDITVQYKNTGNVNINPEVTFSLRDSSNEEIGKIRTPESHHFVQAGGEGNIHEQWTNVLSSGEYSAELTFRASPNSPPIVKSTRFIVP